VAGALTLKRLLSWVADRPIAALPLFLIAAAERVAWTLDGHLAMLDTELRNAAISWAHTGWIADAFRAGSGPTAHVGALPPVIPGLVFRLFGVDSPATSLTLTMLSALVVVATALVLSRAFARLGTPAALRGAAVVLISVLPLHYELESRSLRIYENGYAALALALLLLAVVRLDQRGMVTVRDVVGLSAFTAFIVALSPTVGFCAIAMLGVLALRRLNWSGRFGAVAILAVILTLTSLPWALRNQAVLGEMVWTRGNFGLEFAVGTHAAAVTPADPGATYLARLAQVHPHGSDAPYRAMQAAGGELPYARNLGRETWAWVAAHPLDAVTIWARHWREFFFPPPFMWLHTAPPDAATPARLIAVDVIAALALVGLFGALARRQWMFLYLMPPVLLLPLPYLLTQPLVRYRYAIASLLIFLAADCLARLTGRGQGGLKQPV
jgi:hypothetical protein